MKKDWKAFAVFCVVALLHSMYLAELTMAKVPQTTTHAVTLAADPSSTSTPTNPGVYNVQRAPFNADGTCGTFAQIAAGLLTPAYVDTTVVGGANYCYTMTFKYTQSGQGISTESDPSSPVTIVGPIPVTLPPPAKPASPTNLHVVKVQ